MKERPILFSTPMVQALDAGTKLQTRRTKGLEIVNENPANYLVEYCGLDSKGRQVVRFALNSSTVLQKFIHCPYGKPGDLLWVRETFLEEGFKGNYIYKAEHPTWPTGDTNWKPSIHMPRVAARIWLKITNIRVERLHDISVADAIAEGIAETDRWPEAIDRPIYKMYGKSFDNGPGTAQCFDPKLSFLSLWTSINGDKSALSSPWVWVVCFEKVEDTTVDVEAKTFDLAAVASDERRFDIKPSV